MRKKARLTSLQTRVSELRCEGSALTSALQDCFTANLLMGLSTDPDSGDEQSLSSMSSWDAEHDDSSVTSGKRTRGDMGDESDDDTLRKSLRGELDEGESLLGVDVGDDDEMLAGEADADQDLRSSAPVLMTPELADERGLSPEELEDRRRERNRQLARQTRGRKKLFVEALAHGRAARAAQPACARQAHDAARAVDVCRGTAAGGRRRGRGGARALDVFVRRCATPHGDDGRVEHLGPLRIGVGSPTNSASPRDGLGVSRRSVARPAVARNLPRDPWQRRDAHPRSCSSCQPRARHASDCFGARGAHSTSAERDGAVPPMLSTSLGANHGGLSGFTYAPSMACTDGRVLLFTTRGCRARTASHPEGAGRGRFDFRDGGGARDHAHVASQFNARVSMAAKRRARGNAIGGGGRCVPSKREPAPSLPCKYRHEEPIGPIFMPAHDASRVQVAAVAQAAVVGRDEPCKRLVR